MAIPALGYDYEADALADGVLHYWPMFDLFTPNRCVDILQSEELSVYNDTADNTLVKAMLGYARNLTANGTGTLHSVLVHEANATATEELYDWTVAFWFNPTTLVTANQPSLMDTTSTNGFHVWFDFPGSVDTILVDWTAAGIGQMSLAVTPALATDHLVVLTSNSTTGTVEAYIDNTLIGTDSANYQTLALYASKWYFGDKSGLSTSTTYLDGYIDELMVFDYAIDATDRATLYNTGSGLVNGLVKFANDHRIIFTEGLGMGDIGKLNIAASAADILGQNVANEGLLAATGAALDILDMDDVGAAIMAALASVDEELGHNDAFVESIRRYFEVEEGLSFITSFNVSGETYVGVVMNTETSSVSEYHEVPYNSMARTDVDTYMAAGPDGIYEMAGSLDDTANIDAYITTKLFNFGNSQFKRVERAYLGYRNDGPMVLKVITRNSLGERVEDWYEQDSTSDSIRVDRVKIGKGLKSHYWQFTLSNKTGADFDLDSIEFKPIVLSRRVV